MITQDEIKKELNYNPETGIFTWKEVKKYSNRKIGDVAGTITTQGYIVIGYNNKVYRAHRLAWLYVYGEWPIDQIDHINGNTKDNRISNLRQANQSQNNLNRKIPKNSTSGVKGVTWNKKANKWQVQFKLNKKPIYIGLFDDFDLAALIADEARLKYHGNFVYNS